MICQTTTQGTTSNLAVIQDKKLFKSIMQKKFETQFGKYKVKDTMIDWSNIDTTKERTTTTNTTYHRIIFNNSK